MRAQGRICGGEGDDRLENLRLYNNVIQTYIEYIGEAIIDNNRQGQVEMLAFYIAVGLLGQDEQMASYAMFLHKVRDDSI